MNTHDLADRLTRLERENRRLKRIGGVVLLGIVAVVVMGQATRPEVHDVLAAKQFVLKDRDGNDRGKLYLDGDVAMFVLYGRNDLPGALLRASKDGRCGLGLGSPNHPSIVLTTRDRGAFLSANAGGEERFHAHFGASEHGAYSTLRKGDLSRKATMDLKASGADRFLLVDEKGNEVFSAPK